MLHALIYPCGDSFTWMQKWVDTNFTYHRAAAQVLGLMALRLADSVVLPFNYTDYGVALVHYTQEIEKLLSTHGGQGRGNFQSNYIPPPQMPTALFHSVDLQPLKDAVNIFKDRSLQVENELISLASKVSRHLSCNDALYSSIFFLAQYNDSSQPNDELNAFNYRLRIAER